MTAAFLRPLVNTCQKQLLETKWLLAPNRRIGNQWKEQINLGGINTVNLHTETISSAVMRIVSNELAKRELEFVSDIRRLLIVEKVLSELLETGKLNYLHQVESTEKLAQLVAKTINDFRLADLEPDRLNTATLEDPAKTRDLVVLFHAYGEELIRQNVVDYPACLKLAIKLIESPTANLPSTLILISPADLATSRLEANFLASLARHCEYVGPSLEAEFSAKPTFVSKFQRAIGEVNEVQLTLRNIFRTQSESALDHVEVLHTDYTTYVPLIHETLVSILGESNNSIDDLPITFGEGLACIYSRPGRALRSWLRWIRHDYLQTQAVGMIREGLLRFNDNDRLGIGFAQLAHRLRKLSIGFGGDRYGVRMADAIKEAKADIALAAKRLEDSDTVYHSPGYDFGLAAFERLEATVAPMIDASPSPSDSSLDILTAAKHFLERFARTANKLDEYAKEKLLDDIDGMFRSISAAPETALNIWEWLEQLPVESRILASGPRQGCIHVEHVAKGGHSGRAHTHIIGLDDSRFPYRGGQDPLLLDFERVNVSDDLQTSGDINQQSTREYRQLLNRLSGNVWFSYATFSLAGDRELFPSLAMLETFRLVTEQPSASLDEFQKHVGMPESFCGDDDASFINTDQWWYAMMAAAPDTGEKNRLLEGGFGHFQQSRAAQDQHSNDQFTQYDGNVPIAGKELDPTRPDSRRVSPSRLETFGVCPRKFFFRYGLGISPPDEHVVDTEKWLDPLALGNLLHEVFEVFLRDITAQNRIPELAKDLGDLHRVLHEKIDELKRVIPVPNEDAYRRQLQRLEKTCEIFLRREEEHCRTTGAMPWVFEASIGLGDPPGSKIDCEPPVALKLSDGRVLKVGGRIDRVDRIGGPHSSNFAIWDYKSGSDWGFDAGDPIKQGRKLQPFLYVGMLKHRLVAAVGENANVNYFGYFFPSPRTEGLRLQWTTAELRSGDEVLRYICDAIAGGAFPATNKKEDCGFCDYLPICGEPYQTAANSLVQLSTCTDPALDPIRRLRDIELVEMEELQ